MILINKLLKSALSVQSAYKKIIAEQLLEKNKKIVKG